MVAQKCKLRETIRDAQSKAGRFRWAWNTKVETVADDLEAKQADERLTDKKG